MAIEQGFELLAALSQKLSHDLRTPLTVVLGVIDDLLQGYPCSEKDYQDAKQALLKIQDFLDLLKEVRFDNEILKNKSKIEAYLQQK